MADKNTHNKSIREIAKENTAKTSIRDAAKEHTAKTSIRDAAKKNTAKTSIRDAAKENNMQETLKKSQLEPSLGEKNILTYFSDETDNAQTEKSPYNYEKKDNFTNRASDKVIKDVEDIVIKRTLNKMTEGITEKEKKGKNLFERSFDKIEGAFGKKTTAILAATAIIGIMLTIIYENSEDESLLGVQTFNQTEPPIIEEVLSKTTKEIQPTYAKQIEDQLEDILKKIANLGDVDVMVTLKSSSEKILAEDVNTRINIVDEIDSQGGKSTITEEDHISSIIMSGTAPYVIREDMPQIEGVLVVAQGGDNVSIQSAIINAVSSLLDIPVHKVTVLKMENK